MHDLRVVQPRRPHGPPQEGAPALGALHQRHPGAGQRHREGEAREAHARAEVRDRPRAPHSIELEGDERVREMGIRRLGGAANRRRRGRVLEHLEQRGQPPGRRRLELPARGEGLDEVERRAHGSGRASIRAM